MPEAGQALLAARSGYEDKLRLEDAEVAGIFDQHVKAVLQVGGGRRSTGQGRAGQRAWPRLAAAAAGQMGRQRAVARPGRARLLPPPGAGRPVLAG
jgi:hypothetical protein